MELVGEETARSCKARISSFVGYEAGWSIAHCLPDVLALGREANVESGKKTHYRDWFEDVCSF